MGKRAGKIAVIAAVSTLAPTLGLTQQAGGGSPGGLQFDAGVSSTLKADSNYSLASGSSPGTSYISDTTLSFGLSKATSAYDFTLTGSSVLRLADLPGLTTHGLEDPKLRFNFTADSSNSRLTLNGFYMNADRNFLNPFQVEREEAMYGLLVGDGGTLTNRKLGFNYQTGINDPLGFTIDAKHDEKDYANVINPLIFENKTDQVTATVSARINPVIVGRVSAGLKHYTADDIPQTDRTTTDYSIGATYDVNPVLQVDAQIGHTDVTTDTIFGRAIRKGLVGSLSLTKTVPNGTVFGSLSTSRNQNGQRVVAQFGRSMLLPNGALSYTLGVTAGDVGDPSVIGTLSYSKQLLSSSIGVSVGRSVSTNGLNQDIVDTRVGVNYNYALDNLSSLGLAFDWGIAEDVVPAGGASTITRTDLTASYTRNLTSDWALTSGMTYRRKTETSKPDADSTAIFVTLGRNFSFRP